MLGWHWNYHPLKFPKGAINLMYVLHLNLISSLLLVKYNPDSGDGVYKGG